MAQTRYRLAPVTHTPAASPGLVQTRLSAVPRAAGPSVTQPGEGQRCEGAGPARDPAGSGLGTRRALLDRKGGQEVLEEAVWAGARHHGEPGAEASVRPLSQASGQPGGEAQG